MEEHFSSIMIKDTTQEPIKESDRRHDHEENAHTCGLDFSISFHLFSVCVQACVCIAIFYFIYFQHVCNLLSFIFIIMINKCITHTLTLWLVMMIKSLCHVKYDDRCRLDYFLVLGLCMIKLMLSLT